MQKNDKTELRQRLSEVQWQVTQNQATERPFTGEFEQHWAKGEYHCICCAKRLFVSDYKFDAGCGWPSFSECLSESIKETQDLSHGMQRVEVSCNACGAHLGHVFNDGPQPTGLRYCINSASLSFSAQSD